MDWLSTFLLGLWDHIAIPIIIAFGAALLVIFKNRFDKISKSIVAKNEIADMEKKNNIRRDLMEMIEQSVESAVGANMQLADQMKEGGMHITDAQKEKLNTSAKQLVINSLPLSLTEDGGVLLEIIGGKERLNSIIDVMMEKHVYEYKLEKMRAGGTHVEEKKEKPTPKPEPKPKPKPQRKDIDPDDVPVRRVRR